MFLMAGLGLVVGIPLGFGIHRGGFCMHSASREFLSGTPSSSLLAYLLALGIQFLLVNGLAGEGLFSVPVPPLTWLAALTGGKSKVSGTISGTIGASLAILKVTACWSLWTPDGI